MWVIVTIVAAAFQSLRTAQQQKLRSVMSVNAAGFVRYGFGVPLSGLAVVIGLVSGHGWPTTPARFWPLIIGAGVLQIVATNLMIRSFSMRSFAIGSVYTKSEVVLVAVFSALVLDEPIKPLGWLAVIACTIGVVALALGSAKERIERVFDRTAVVGIVAGGTFGLCAVLIRAASKSLGDDPALWRALISLFVMNASQVLINGGQMIARDRDGLATVARHWRQSAVVGALSVAGSAGWAIGMTLENAAKVRTVGQVDLVLIFLFARLWFGERPSRREIAATALVAVGVVGVIVLG